METAIALAVGQALLSKLSAFQEIGGRSLLAIWHAQEQGGLDQVIFDFGPVSFIVNAVPNDDTIDFYCTQTNNLSGTAREDVSESKFWKESIGLPFGWGWVTVNQQGYCDGMLVSFGGIQPQVVMNVMASSIKLHRINSTSEA